MKGNKMTCKCQNCQYGYLVAHYEEAEKQYVIVCTDCNFRMGLEERRKQEQAIEFENRRKK